MYVQKNSDLIIFNLISNSTFGIFYTTKATTGCHRDNLCCHIAVLNHEHSTVDLLTGLSENDKKHTADYADVSYYRSNCNIQDVGRSYDVLNVLSENSQ